MGFFDFFKSKEEKEDKIVARTPLNLQIGDIVEYDLMEYKVIGKIDYEEGGYKWYDYHISDGKNNLWLSAEEDDELEVGLFKKLDSGDELYSKLQEKIPNKITFNNQAYSLIEEGNANIMVEGQVGAKTGQRIRYWDYEASNGEQVSVEKWVNELEISIGQEVKKSLLEYYPGK
ncbi:DUF4178 domain-containing protein [Orenia marismortui]|uniref:Uncharacterized protein DUF4178 n=1 Tax=Orenia marismortui TaxID=46469 RepID=A0A4R8H8I2_9FIRM|nr:DUF4178 domain-containing protein [Orenia marismortui]TDX51539.1 uncharacterized protein DUF4178 [Orenia marismortui]